MYFFKKLNSKKGMIDKKYDLEERLIAFSSEVIKLTEKFPRSLFKKSIITSEKNKVTK